MSNRHTELGDWSSDSEALFHSARADHAPTAADRARVRSTLAQRLAAAPSALVAGGGAQAARAGRGASRAVLGSLAKIGLGVALVMAGAFVLMRANESRKPAAPKPATAQTIATGTKPAEQVAEPAVPLKDAVAISSHEPAPVVVSRSESVSPARVVPARSRARSTAAKVSTSASAPARFQQKLTAAEPTALDLQPRAIESASASTEVVARDSTAEVALAPRADAQPPSAATPSQARARPAGEAAIANDSTDGRAELAFVARINAALLESKLPTVLALCAQHERRWPHGAFVQEREGLRAIASCTSGVLGAEAGVRAFLASYPRSPLAARVRDACAPQLTAAANERSAFPSGKGDKK